MDYRVVTLGYYPHGPITKRQHDYVIRFLDLDNPVKSWTYWKVWMTDK